MLIKFNLITSGGNLFPFNRKIFSFSFEDLEHMFLIPVELISLFWTLSSSILSFVYNIIYLRKIY